VSTVVALGGGCDFVRPLLDDKEVATTQHQVEKRQAPDGEALG